MKKNTAIDNPEASVFDTFPWWNPRDVLLQITPARFDYLRLVAGPLEGVEVLDVGSGGGYLAEQLALAGASVTGIDVSAAAVEVARRHAASSGLQIEYRQSPAEEIPFSRDHFDLAVAFDVLEHVEDLDKTLSEVARVLKPAGRLIYDTNNRTLLSRLVMLWIGENLWPGGPPKGTHDWNKFIKPPELFYLLEKHGIENRETRGFCPVGLDSHGGLKMRLCPLRWVAYVGYGDKVRAELAQPAPSS